MGDTGAAADLPQGTVTFLFTDLEGSTRLLQAHPAAYRDAVRRHDDLLRGAVEGHGGTVFETVGDAVYAAFARPTDAVAAALAGQLALQGEAWGATGELRARMGLHLGEAERQGGHYFGAPLYRAGRLLATAHGGQVVLSEVTAGLVRDALPEGASLRDLGEHRLKDLQRPEHLFQVVRPDLPADFPPLRTLDAVPHNLPLQLTSFVGRERELGEVAGLLATHRLVTLSGPGGVGKTRLALQVAAEGLEAYPGGAWVVELAALRDPALVPQEVASVVGVREEPGRPLLATLTDALKPRRLLLVLDNCEHLVEACARLAETLLRACPHLHLLATSREALGIAGEAPWRVPSLSLPAAGPGPAAAVPASSEAVRLFAERATTVRPGFALTEQNAAAVAQICRRLDGIPLALELAAARVRVLPAEQVLARLDDRFRLLTGGSRTALERHQTLRATVDWSYDLLAPAERSLFARLSVFAGGWTLPAAEAVGAGAGIEADEVLDLLTRLVDKSLAVVDDTAADGVGRYGMPETLRQYARERLAGGRRAAAARRRRHAAFYLGVAEAAAREVHGPAQVTWLDRLEREHDNLRAALDWCVASGGAELGLRLAGALRWFWAVRGYWREGCEWIQALLALPGAAARPVLRARALLGLVPAYPNVPLRDAAARATARAAAKEALALFRAAGDREGVGDALWAAGLVTWWGGSDRARAEARARFEECVSVRRELGDPAGVAWALNQLGVLVKEQDGGAAARPLFEEALALRRATGDVLGLSFTVSDLGHLARERGDRAAARRLYEQGLALRRELGERHYVARSLGHLAQLAADEGDLAAARAGYAAALAQYRDAGHVPFVFAVLARLAAVAAAQGDAAAARARLAERLELAREWGAPAVVASSLEELAVLAAADRPARALRLAAAAAVARTATGAEERVSRAFPPPAGQPALAQRLAPARAALSQQAQDAAWAAGQALTLEEAVADALELEDAPALA